jgi:hypothetical protein
VHPGGQLARKRAAPAPPPPPPADPTACQCLYMQVDIARHMGQSLNVVHLVEAFEDDVSGSGAWAGAGGGAASGFCDFLIAGGGGSCTKGARDAVNLGKTGDTWRKMRVCGFTIV